MEAKPLAPAYSAVLGRRSSPPTRLLADHSSSSLRFPSSRVVKIQASSASAPGSSPEKRVDESRIYTLEGIRSALILQEESIILNLVERSHFLYNAPTYDPNAFSMDGFHGSLVEFMVKETEKLHARVGRYKNPGEHTFFPDNLPQPLLLPLLEYPKVLHSAADTININVRVWNLYFRNLLPGLVRKGDDGNYGSTATCDTLCLQSLSKRIHYGKFVAEAKFRAAPDVYEDAIRAQDGAKLMDLLTYVAVEEAITKRVELKTRKYGQAPVTSDDDDEDKMEAEYKINPTIVADLYNEWIMPLTKQVQVDYLLRRLD